MTNIPTGIGMVVFYPGVSIVIGDLEGTIGAYEKIIRDKRIQVIIPSAITLLGVIAIGVVIYLLIV